MHKEALSKLCGKVLLFRKPVWRWNKIIRFHADASVYTWFVFYLSVNSVVYRTVENEHSHCIMKLNFEGNLKLLRAFYVH